MNAGVRSIAIVGRGPSLWLAAIALQRAFGRTGLVVTIVEMPSAARAHDAHAALPDLTHFHKLLRIGEAELIHGADASFVLGQQFSGWSGDGSAFVHGYGATGEALGGLPFLQLWVKARAGGMRVSYDDFTLNSVAARNGRIAAPGTTPGTAHGYHLDAPGYEAMLRRHAAALGLPIVRDAAPQAQVARGAIAAIALSDGRALAADLYIDATGTEARLIGALDPDPIVIAPRASPCDRLLTASAPPLAPIPLHGRIAAHRAGWLGLFPLQRRTAVAMAYAGSAMSDDDAARSATRLSGLRLAPDMHVIAIRDRARTRPWVANCVAIGEAAWSGDPIDAVALHRDQIGITRLLALVPTDRTHMVEADIYNEEITAQIARTRDFQAVHFRLNARHGEAFWDAARGAPISDALAYKLDLFAARGLSAQYNHETFNLDSWQAALLGHGLVPRSYDPQADAVPDQDVARHLQQQLGRIRQDVTAMGSHRDALDRARAAR